METAWTPFAAAISEWCVLPSMAAGSMILRRLPMVLLRARDVQPPSCSVQRLYGLACSVLLSNTGAIHRGACTIVSGSGDVKAVQFCSRMNRAPRGRGFLGNHRPDFTGDNAFMAAEPELLLVDSNSPSRYSKYDQAAGIRSSCDGQSSRANENIPSPRHRVKTVPREQSIRFPFCNLTVRASGTVL
jgi:hypothetical protein